jgi:hypothetical protein
MKALVRTLRRKSVRQGRILDKGKKGKPFKTSLSDLRHLRCEWFCGIRHGRMGLSQVLAHFPPHSSVRGPYELRAASHAYERACAKKPPLRNAAPGLPLPCPRER